MQSRMAPATAKVAWSVVDIIKHAVSSCDMAMACGNREERRKAYRISPNSQRPVCASLKGPLSMAPMVSLTRAASRRTTNSKPSYEMSVMYLLSDIVYAKPVSSGLLRGGRRLESRSSGSDGSRKRFLGGTGPDKKEAALIKGSVLLCVAAR